MDQLTNVAKWHFLKNKTKFHKRNSYGLLLEEQRGQVPTFCLLTDEHYSAYVNLI